MITREEIQAGKHEVTLKTLVNGGTGTGKTYYAFTHPKIAYLGTEPNGLDTARTNKELLENLVWAEEFIPSPTEDIKAVFERLDVAVRKAHSDTAIKTLVLDNITYLSENRWIYINKYEALRTGSGALDTRGMYGTLSRWLYNFTLTQLLSFKGNVVVTCHEQSESEEAMEKKVDKTTPIVPSILGGFREKISGMFSASIYLEKKRISDNKYNYTAICQHWNQREAKNRYGLPEIVSNVSYQTILASMGNGATK